MAARAAVGSSKNMTPNWLTARSNGPNSSVPVCTSMSTKRTLNALLQPLDASPTRARPTRCRIPPPRRRRDSVGQGDRQRSAATPDVEKPLTRSSVDRLDQVGSDGVSEAFPFWPRDHPPGLIPPPGFHSLATGAPVARTATFEAMVPRALRHPPQRPGGLKLAANGNGRTTSGSRRDGPTTTSAGPGRRDGPWHERGRSRRRPPRRSAHHGGPAPRHLGGHAELPRHPATLGRDAIVLDDLSDGRRADPASVRGARGPTPSSLGQEPWPPAERMARFEEFLRDSFLAVLTGDGTTSTSMRTEMTPWPAVEAPSTPGTSRSRPRSP